MLSFSYPQMFLFTILCCCRLFTAAHNIGVGVGLKKKHCRPLEVFVRAQSKPSAKFGIEALCAMCSSVWLGWCLSSASWSWKYVFTSPNISQVLMELTLNFCANLFCFLKIGDFLYNNRSYCNTCKIYFCSNSITVLLSCRNCHQPAQLSKSCWLAIWRSSSWVSRGIWSSSWSLL